MLSEFQQVGELVIVDPAHDDAIDLGAAEAGTVGRLQTAEHLRVRVAPCQCPKSVRAKRIEAHRDAMEPCVAKRLGVLGEVNSVRRQRQVLDLRIFTDQPDQPGKVSPQQRLATGQPHVVHAQGGEGTHQFADFPEREQLFPRQPDVFLLGHAVTAAQVAPVGDRDTQAAQGSAEYIC